MRRSQRQWDASAAEEAVVGGVANAELGARRLHDLRDARVVHVADAREQVVLDLEVEPTHVPGQQPIAPREVDRGQHLMHRPRAWDALGPRRPLGKIRLLHAVGEHEHDGQGGAEDERRRGVEEEHDPPRVKQQRNRERPAEEQQLAAHELDQMPATRSREPAPPYPPRVTFLKSSTKFHFGNKNQYSAHK